MIGLSPDDDEFERNRVALRLKVSRDIRGPAEVIREGNCLFVIIPEGYADPEPVYSLMPYVARLNPLTERGEIDFFSSDPANHLLATRFLQAALSDRLWHAKELWQPKAGRPFYFKTPANVDDSSRLVDVFEGFSFRIVWVEEVGYCVLIDRKTHYVSSEPWPEYIPFDRRWQFLRHSPDVTSKGAQRTTHCIYQFGHQWYEILVQTIRKEGIAETFFPHPKTNSPISVYDYTMEKWNETLPDWCATVKGDWTAITYVTWKDGPKRHGAAHLCFPVMKIADLQRMGLSDLHRRYAIKEPDIRLNTVTRFVRRWMRDVKLGEHTIVIADEPLEVNRQVFPIPRLEFGGGRVLDISSTPDRLRHYPKDRMRILRDSEGGFWDSDPLQEQWSLVLRDLKDTVWPAFRQDLAKEIKRFCGTNQKYKPNVIWYDDLEEGLYYQAKAIGDAIERKTLQQSVRPSGYCLAILPANAEPELPAYLTSTLSQTQPPLHVVCIHLDSFAQFYIPAPDGDGWCLDANRKDIGRIKGYLRNVAVKLLLLNNRWPYVFIDGDSLSDREKRLLSTLFIGFDVLNSVAGFTFVGNGGRICFFVPVDSEEKESISSRKVRKIVKDYIPKLSMAYGWRPQRVVLIRDGRLYEDELKGFKQATQELRMADACAVEIPKQSALGVRFFDETRNNAGRTRVRNPRLGCWFKLNEDEIIICNTGWPFTIQGTSIPLTVRKKWGEGDIAQLGEDMFDLAQLAWTAPDRPARYPLVIRYTDMRLQAIATDFDEEETEFGPEDEAESEREEEME